MKYSLLSQFDDPFRADVFHQLPESRVQKTGACFSRINNEIKPTPDKELSK
ncbi:hypothetical protein [Oceanisphaera sp.]|uniref:hypothetical protein n=1 Tax=Oceanisphaera sp. TaxID=1929979 RepID=UPI003A911E2E